MIKQKRKIILGVSILVVACLILSGIYIIFEYQEPEEKTTKKPTTVIDDRISPLENQGLVFEILRMRDRGLLDKLLSYGNSWKEKPKFYFITDMDGLEYISKNVEQHDQVDEVFFNDWDTMFQENKIIRDVPEGTETSTATLTIMERVKSGVLGLKTTDVERESFTVTYDYRTGRWTGDDYFMDDDGYGHYLGDNFEIWFNLYQFDCDGDQIPYWTEVNILGTDPTVDDSKLDPDGDGIPTYWEWRWGYDPFTWDNHAELDPDLDGLDNLEEYQMADWFADPYSEDIYIEADYMGRGSPFDPPHVFYKESQQGIIERFAEHNIRVYIDDGWPNGPIHGGGDVLPHIERVSQDSGMVLQFYNSYFPEERRGIFRYLILGHKGGFSHTAKDNIYDVIYLPTLSGPLELGQVIPKFLANGILPTERGRRVALGSAAIHELAHSCSVSAESCDFWGIDNLSGGWPFLPNKEYVDTWGNYVSSLNYLLMYKPYQLGLSDGSNGPPYDQDDWSMIFPGYFQYNRNDLIEEPFYDAGDAVTKVDVEHRITGYTYDENLTEQYKDYIGDYSPMDPIKVNWYVYKVNDDVKDQYHKDVKVFAQPDIKTTDDMVLYSEGNLDSDGIMHFYSYDDFAAEKLGNMT